MPQLFTKARLFSLGVEPAGVLAPKVQATAIEVRVPPPWTGVNAKRAHSVRF